MADPNAAQINGHPVYTFLFSSEPEPAQKLADVATAEIKFLEKVVRRHPDLEVRI